MNSTDNTFEITGGRQLSGSVEVRGAKNATFPLLAAALLTDEECVIDNLPLIEDVYRMVEVIDSLGASVEWTGERQLSVQAGTLAPESARTDIIERFRGSILLYGALLGRTETVELPRPGGCIIGARSIDTHLDAFTQLGAEMERQGKSIRLEWPRSGGKEERRVTLQEFSVTATCNTLLAAAREPRTTTVAIADEDYQVQELLAVLETMGVTVHHVGHHTITIEGRERLRGFQHTIMYDPLEAGTFICLAAATNSEVTVRNVEIPTLELFLKKLQDAHLPLTISPQEKTVRVGEWETISFPTKLQSLPFPGMHSDLLSSLAVVATQATGSTLIQDPLYEGRFKYLEEITQMGADIFFADPHRVVVHGPTELYGKRLGPLDLRGGAALIIAALAAEGTSRIESAYQIDRGYERIEERLRDLGAQIKRV